MGNMVRAFLKYMKATGKTCASFKEVVVSTDGLGYEGAYSEWYFGNKHRNMNKIFTDWLVNTTPDGYRFIKVSRGRYYPSQGKGIRKFAFRNHVAKNSAAHVDKIVGLVKTMQRASAKVGRSPVDTAAAETPKAAALTAKIHTAIDTLTDLAAALAQADA